MSKTSTTVIDHVRSQDGTEIAYRRHGQGPALIFVDGAFCTKAMGPGKSLAPALHDRFTTVVYDRRGRGDSGGGSTYHPGLEIQDLGSLVAVAGGSPYVFGHSSGAVLALEAARSGLPVAGLVLYEPPFVVDDSRPPVAEDFPDRLAQLAASGRGRAVVNTFMTEAIRAPRPVAALMSAMPGAGRLRQIAPTVAYDATIMNRYQQGTPLPEELRSLCVPMLVIVGAKSPTWMQHGCEALAAVIPNARLARLDGQSHMVKAKATAPLVSAFLAEISPLPADGRGPHRAGPQ